MPSSSACVKPSRADAGGDVLERGQERAAGAMAPSQPSHLASSAPVHSDASLSQSRRVPPALSHCCAALPT